MRGSDTKSNQNWTENPLEPESAEAFYFISY